MGRIKQAGKWLLILVCLVLLAAATLWTISRLVYPNAAQRQAIAEMERWPAYEGENAFALLWTLNRAVPDDELAAVMAEDVLNIEVDAPRDEAGPFLNPSAEDVPSASHAFPDLTPSEEDRRQFCPGRETGCLARVRSDLEGHAARVNRHAPLLDRVEQLGRYGYVRSEFPYSLWAPLPSYDSAFLLRTRHAVQFAEGRHLEAVAATCRDMLTWRRLGARSDSLILRLTGDAISSRENGWLLADMLAELPVDAPLPEVCEQALVPPNELELSLCNAMRGEFGISAHATRTAARNPNARGWERWRGALLFSPEASVGIQAEGRRALCPVITDVAQMQRQLTALSRQRQSRWRLECIANQMGCVLEALAVPNGYMDYAKRVVDHGARLRALATLAWMRGQAGQGQTPEELLAARPDELIDEGDALRFGPEGKTLRITLRDTRRDTELEWVIALPPALYAKPSGS